MPRGACRGPAERLLTPAALLVSQRVSASFKCFLCPATRLAERRQQPTYGGESFAGEDVVWLRQEALQGFETSLRTDKIYAQ